MSGLRLDNTYFFKEYNKKRPRKRNSRSNNPSTRISIALSARRWQANNPHKLAAHKWVKNNIYRKGIRPSECIYKNCNCSGQTEAHHSDYTKIDQIVWICRKHHKAWHRVFLPEGGE